MPIELHTSFVEVSRDKKTTNLITEIEQIPVGTSHVVFDATNSLTPFNGKSSIETRAPEKVFVRVGTEDQPNALILQEKNAKERRTIEGRNITKFTPVFEDKKGRKMYKYVWRPNEKSQQGEHPPTTKRSKKRKVRKYPNNNS